MQRPRPVWQARQLGRLGTCGTPRLGPKRLVRSETCVRRRSAYGVCLRLRSWYEDGRGLVDERFGEGDWQLDLVARRKARFEHLTETGPIPDDFRDEPELPE